MMNEAPPGGFGSGPSAPIGSSSTMTTMAEVMNPPARDRSGWVRVLQVITWIVLLLSSGPMVFAASVTFSSLHETNCMHPGNAEIARGKLVTLGVLLLIYLVFAGPPAVLLVARKTAFSVFIAAGITAAALLVSCAEFLVFLFMQACLE